MSDNTATDQPIEKAVPSELREALADYAHEAWSGWMKYMLPILHLALYDADDGKWHVTADAARLDTYGRSCLERWLYQMQTPYSELPEEMRPSDRKEADKMLALMLQHVRYVIFTTEAELDS